MWNNWKWNYIIDEANFIENRIIFDKEIFTDLEDEQKHLIEKIIRKCFNNYLGNFVIFSNKIYFDELSLSDNYKEDIKSGLINPNRNPYKKMIANKEFFKKSVKDKKLFEEYISKRFNKLRNELIKIDYFKNINIELNSNSIYDDNGKLKSIHYILKSSL